MTICLGALCADSGAPNQIAVVACDRMVTLGQEIEFEHEVPKVMSLTASIVCASSGAVLDASSLMREIKRGLPADPLPVADVARQFADLYVVHRKAEINSQIFQPRSMTIDAFYRGLMQHMPNAIVSFLDEEASTHDFGVSLLIAGVDEGGAHLFDVTDPGGAVQDHLPIGFHAIGSGGFQATQQMISFGHSGKKRLPETIFHVYASKRRAEVAPGVGKDTDMLVISGKGIRWLSQAELDQLDEIYLAWARPLDEATKTEVAKLPIVTEIG